MGTALSINSKVVYNSTKLRMEKEFLVGESFNLSLTSIEKKEWKALQDKVSKVAHVLLSEVHRSKGNYKRLNQEELSKDFQSNDSHVFFDFFSETGSVRIGFEKGEDRHISYSHIEEVIHEESYSLF